MSEEESNRVVVTDIKMPFWSMVVFLVKLSIAAIPAAIIIVAIVMSSSAILAGVISSIQHSSEKTSFGTLSTEPSNKPHSGPMMDLSNHKSGFGDDVPDRCKGSTELERCIELTRQMNLKK